MVMSFVDFCRLLRRRWPVVIVMTLVWVVVAAVVVQLQPRTYQATATVQVTSHDSTFLAQVDQVIQTYAEAAKSRDTQAMAQAAGAGPLATIAVRTFLGSPVLKIDATDTSPEVAQRTAAAVTRALLTRAASGEVGITGLSLLVVEQPSLPTAPIAPTPKLTLAIAAVVGLGLGIGTAMLGESLREAGTERGSEGEPPRRGGGGATSAGTTAVNGRTSGAVRPRGTRASRPATARSILAEMVESRPPRR
jgi:capsular polysaccharide biosynthesis protein